MTTTAVPDSARGTVRDSVFWTLNEAEQDRFRRGWFDAYDRRRPRGTSRGYLAGYRESAAMHGAREEVTV